MSIADRSEHMARIGPVDTKPELAVRRALHAAGFRYRLHQRNLPGRPDLVFKKYHAVIFVHGCFWHRHKGCRLAYKPKSNKRLWSAKLRGNKQRDRRQVRALLGNGWRV